MVIKHFFLQINTPKSPIFQNCRFSKWPFFKITIFKIANSQKNFVKISLIGPWVSRINWCKEHWCSSTYMVVRLSDVRSKTALKHKNAFFAFFWAYVWQPHDHIGWAKSMPFASINSIQPRSNPWNFQKRKIENWRFWKTAILKNQPFWIFFCLIPMKISHKLCGTMDGYQFWCFLWFPAKSLLCVIYRYTVYVPIGCRLKYGKFHEIPALGVA